MLFCCYVVLLISPSRQKLPPPRQRRKTIRRFLAIAPLPVWIWLDKNCAHLFFSTHIHPAKQPNGLKKRQIEKKALQKKAKQKK